MKIHVVGAGGWGLALARLLARNGHRVRLWCREEDNPDRLRETRENPALLRGVLLPDSVEVCRDVDPDVDIAVLAVPSHVMRTIVKRYPFSQKTIRVSVAKGIENETLLRMSQVIQAVGWRPEAGDSGVNSDSQIQTTECANLQPTAYSLQPRIVALSGPSHAEEVGRDLPASVVAAGVDAEACKTVQEALVGKTFRVYTSPDIVGVELGGSLKNVIALAAGVCDGFGLGDNAKAALITRGLAEITRLGVALGADPLTFAGLSGMGDLIVTCMSRHSRNRAVGERVAKGETLEQVLGGTAMVAEGVRTTRSAHDLAIRAGIEMPITDQVYHVLFEGGDPRETVVALMSRDAKPERG